MSERAIYTIEEAARAARKAEKATLVAELEQFTAQAHPKVLAEAQDVLRAIDTWSVQELTPMLPKLRTFDRLVKRWDTLTPEQQQAVGDDAYRALYREERR